MFDPFLGFIPIKGVIAEAYNTFCGSVDPEGSCNSHFLSAGHNAPPPISYYISKMPYLIG